MARAELRPETGAFEQIEETILPSISIMLDTLLDAASLGRPGVDADVYAGELRALAAQLTSLTGEVEALAPAPFYARPRSTSAA